MPVMICSACNVKLEAFKNDVYLDETAQFGHYKLWVGDLYKCPGCGVEIVSGLGKAPIAEHYEERFEQIMEEIKANNRKVVVWNEHVKKGDSNG